MRDFGVQCCFEPITHRSIATQTDVSNGSQVKLLVPHQALAFPPQLKQKQIPQNMQSVRFPMTATTP